MRIWPVTVTIFAENRLRYAKKIVTVTLQCKIPKIGGSQTVDEYSPTIVLKVSI